MIVIRAHLGDGHLRLEVDGHEGHAVDGRVCAAVSAIASTAVLGLEQVALKYPGLVSISITEEQKQT